MPTFGAYLEKSYGRFPTISSDHRRYRYWNHQADQQNKAGKQPDATPRIPSDQEKEQWKLVYIPH